MKTVKSKLGRLGRYKVATQNGSMEITARPFYCRGEKLLLHRSTFFPHLVATHARCGFQVWRNGNAIVDPEECVRAVRKEISGEIFLRMCALAATKPVLNP